MMERQAALADGFASLCYNYLRDSPVLFWTDPRIVFRNAQVSTKPDPTKWGRSSVG